MAKAIFESLEIRQFRRFEHLTIEKLGQVNLIVGKNNVGKSTILEALHLYANLGAPQVILDILNSRDDLDDGGRSGLASRTARGPAVWSLFHGHRELNKIDLPVGIGPISSPDSTLSIGIEWFTENVDGAGKVVLQPASVTEAGASLEIIPALTVKIGGMKRVMRLDRDFKTYCRRWQFQPKSFLALATNCVCVGPHGLSPGQLERMWGAVALTELEDDVVDALQIIVPEVDDFAVLNRHQSSGEMTVRIKPSKTSAAESLRCMGDGMNRLFGIGMAMVNAGKGLLLLDEIENGIHYSALPAVWRFILRVARRLEVQVFATTHSSDCVTAFQQATKEDANIEGILTRLEIKDGEVKASLYDEERLEKVVRANIETR